MANVAIKRVKKGLQDIFTFGKYKGRIIGDICKEDPLYVLWVNENVDWFRLEWAVVQLAEEWRPDRVDDSMLGEDGWGDYDGPYY